jgi:peptidyl-dipeptidase Dcp
MKRYWIPSLVAGVSFLASGSAAPQASSVPAASSPNPFSSASTLQFETPPFDKIKDSDYPPAFEEGMKQQLAEVEAIASQSAPPTFANTIEAMERTGVLLTRVSKVFFNLAQSNTSAAIQKIRAEVAPKLASHQDTIYLNARLFARIKTLYDARASLGLDPEASYLLEQYNKTFVRAGAVLSDSDKATLRALNQEEAKLSTDFTEKVLADTNASAVVVENKSDLDGLSDGDIAAAALAAKERGFEGKWVLALQNTTQQPPLASLKNRALRERILQASMARCNRGGNTDTKATDVRLAQVRAQKAKLLGFETAAAYILDDQMAKTPQNAEKLMTDLVPAATDRARAEAARLQQTIDSEKGGFRLRASDWEFYSQKVRKAEYDLDESAVRPYLELDRVLRDGVFFAANQLYGITFKERKDIPVYQPDVRVFEVFDTDGKPLALYFGDYFARPNKSGGAWCDTFVDQSTLMGTHPVVVNVTNFSKPAPGQPALLSSDDLRTIFHEFGHALHAMFTHIKYPLLGNVPRDFVECPSQFNEHWSLEPAVFQNFAKHYQTGKPMPPPLVEKIKKSHIFNQGYATTEYLASALLDMAWHTLPPEAPQQDVNTFEKAALERFHVDIAEVPPRYHTTYFSHIWSGGYSAGYYAYLWSAVLDNDAYAWFKEHGGMTRANGQRFREMVLSHPGTQDVAAMYRAFRGRDANVEALLEDRGLKKSGT